MRAFAVAALSLLAACEANTDVTVRQLPNGRVAVHAYSSPPQMWTCVGSVSFYRLPEGARPSSPEGVEVWAIRGKRDAFCRSRFTFPEVPPGFELLYRDQSEMPLRPGEKYFVVVGIEPFDATVVFVAEAR
jgi:hypothetical protein